MRPLVFLITGLSLCAWSVEPETSTKTSESVDLRPSLEELGLCARQQGARPTCSAFTMTSALEFALAKQHGKTPRLSVEFLNWAANDIGPDDQDGGFFSELWKGYAKHGICPETQSPYQPKFDLKWRPDSNQLAAAKQNLNSHLKLHWIKEWDVKTGLTEEHFKGIQKMLKAGWPVCAGMRWPIHAQWEGNVMQMCKPSEVVDGHSVLLVGFRDDATQSGGGVFLCRNTGGSGKDAAIPYAYIREYVNDAVWVGPADWTDKSSASASQ
jgi:hypothetical protein